MGLRELLLVERNRARAEHARLRQFSQYTINPATGCWLFLGVIGSDGYGKVKRYGKTLRAHRVYYEHFVGPVPTGLLVCHRCDTPGCVNPAHLFCGTQLDNEHDKDAKGRRPPSWFQLDPTRRKRGEGNSAAKLTAEQVARIRRCKDTAALAREYGVCRTTIQRARRGENWGHIPMFASEEEEK